MSNHSAVGPALGYYYQAIYALITLFDSSSDNAYVSIETLDDVYHEDGSVKNLIQLKHKTKENTTISIKSEDLWNTLNVWCDYIKKFGINDGIFTLSTVSTIPTNSILNTLQQEKADRSQLTKELLEEANSVLHKRSEQQKENLNLRSKGEKEKKIPYESKYKGCEAFKNLNDYERKTLIEKIRILPSSFTIKQTNLEVEKRLKNTLKKYRTLIAEDIISWWDRQAVKSLTKERNDCIAFSELQEFIMKKNQEYYNDGFTNDLKDIELPPPDITNKIHNQQLELIIATASQKKRSFDTEIKARLQRSIWIERNLIQTKKLTDFDEILISEWSYEFDDIDNTLEESKLQEKGRNLLDWSHKEAIKQINSISSNYQDHNLIRGSYQMLSKELKVGWHAKYKEFISKDEK